MSRQWDIQTLSDVCTLISGQHIMAEDYNTTGNGIGYLTGPSDFGEYEPTVSKWTLSPKQIALPGDILVTVKGSGVGTVNLLVDEQVAISRQLMAVRVTGAEAMYVHAFLRFQLATLRDKATGAAIPGLSRNDLLSLQIPLPSISEQKRIVAVLDEVFAGIDAAIFNIEKNLANARGLFESYLNSAFNKTDKGPKTALGMEVDLISGFAFKSTGYTDSDNSIRLLRGDNIAQGFMRWTDAKRWNSEEAHKYTGYQLKAGDVVLAMDRPWVKAGLKRAQIGPTDLPCLLVQRTARLRAGPRMDARYLMHLTGTPLFTQHLLSAQTGIGVPHISANQIKAFSFRLPSIEEQRLTARDLDIMADKSQELVNVAYRKLSCLAELKQSILQKAFAGELTAKEAEREMAAA